MLQFKPIALNATQRKKAEKAGVSIASMTEADRYYGGPPLGHLSMEYLFCSNVFLLSRLYHLFGEEKNGKSTLAIDWLDRFFLGVGGSGLLVETENKMNVELIHKMLLDRFPTLQQCRNTILEQSQAAMTAFARTVKDDTKKKQLVLGGIDIDSFRVLSEKTVETTVAQGSASRNYAIEAALWRTYLNSFINLMQDMPLALIVVNHAREEDVEGTSIKTLGCGGGTALKFLESYRILVKITKRIEQVNTSKAMMSLTTISNSNGPNHRRIFPEIVYRGGDDPDVDHIYIDWDAADAQLLCGDAILRSALAKQEVCDVKAATEKGLYNDDILGLKKVPITDITSAIYADASRLDRFRKLHQITVYKTLEELYDAGWFFDSKTVKRTDDEDEEA